MIEIKEVHDYKCSYCQESFSAQEIDRATQKTYGEPVTSITKNEDTYHVCPECDTLVPNRDWVNNTEL